MKFNNIQSKSSRSFYERCRCKKIWTEWFEKLHKETEAIGSSNVDKRETVVCSDGPKARRFQPTIKNDALLRLGEGVWFLDKSYREKDDSLSEVLCYKTRKT